MSTKRCVLACVALAALLLGFLAAAPGEAAAPVKIMCLGDSITNGNAGYVAYRYPLYFDLTSAGYNVDFVGTANTIYNESGTHPNASLYPNYYTTFDRDHDGWWGWRADQIRDNVVSWATTSQPDIVLLHIGSNDIMQNHGTNAQTITEMGSIIDNLRTVNPNVKVLVAEIIPLPSQYNVTALNALIPALVTSKNTAQSPVYLVDQYTGYNVSTYSQSDATHPNQLGGQFMATRWEGVLEPILVPEPSSLALLLAGVAGAAIAGAWRLRTRKTTS
jgi:acyl-CoA thioesterase I